MVAEVAGVAAAVEVDSPELDAPTTLLADYGLHGHLDAQPRYRRGARSRPPSHELDALAAETEDEDARSDALGVAFSLELPRDTLGRAVTHRRAHAILTSHLLVSTGLARGPPIA